MATEVKRNWGEWQAILLWITERN